MKYTSIDSVPRRFTEASAILVKLHSLRQGIWHSICYIIYTSINHIKLNIVCLYNYIKTITNSIYNRIIEIYIVNFLCIYKAFTKVKALYIFIKAFTKVKAFYIFIKAFTKVNALYIVNNIINNNIMEKSYDR